MGILLKLMSLYSSTRSNILCGHNLRRARHRRNDFISPIREETVAIHAAFTGLAIAVADWASKAGVCVAAGIDLRVNAGAAAKEVGVGAAVALLESKGVVG